MRIGIDVRLWNETGVGRYIRNLVLNLQKLDKKNNYSLFALSKDRQKILNQVQNDNFRIIETNIKWHSVSEQVKFSQVLLKEKLDIVHFPYYSVPVFYNKPFIVTIHDLIPYNYPTGRASTLPFFFYWLKFLAYKYVLKNASKKAAKIIAVSNATKEEIVNHLKVNEDRIAVIYEGVDDKIRNNHQNTKYKIQNTKYFLYVGNAYPHKNVEILINAFNILKSKYPDISIVLVGKNDHFYEKLKNYVQKMNLTDKIIFLQNVKDEELSALYQNAMALVHPSLVEGFGLPPLEAMTNNCLVLVSDIPAFHEVCVDAAVYFNSTDAEDLAQKMDKIYADNKSMYIERIKKGFERAKMFSWEKMAKETLRVYDSQMISNKI